MKKEQVPQEQNDFNLFPLGYYATDEKGEFGIVSSVGWQATNEGWGDRLDLMRQHVTEARRRVERGEASPLHFHMVVRRFEPGLLASYLGMWTFQVKRHLKPKVFARLSPQALQRYADFFKITVEELRRLPDPSAPLPLEQDARYRNPG